MCHKPSIILGVVKCYLAKCSLNAHLSFLGLPFSMSWFDFQHSGRNISSRLMEIRLKHKAIVIIKHNTLEV